MIGFSAIACADNGADPRGLAGQMMCPSSEHLALMAA
jgi:hypothetical protein